MSKRKITNALEILDRRYYRGRPERIAERDAVAREMALGEKIHQIREEAGLTQRQLAEQIGTQTSAISRIESADYDSHSLSTLKKIADALGMRLLVDFEPKGPATQRKARES